MEIKKENNSLYQLCENIVQTGELDEDSIRQLAEHINNDPNAYKCWPGNKLLAPLKKVWDDGVIDKSEIYLLKFAIENIINNPEKTPNEIAAIEKAGLYDNKEIKTDAERARGGCWMSFFLCLIILTVALGVSGDELYIFPLIITILLGAFFILAKTLGVGYRGGGMGRSYGSSCGGGD
jgi:hypothetical protein